MNDPAKDGSPHGMFFSDWGRKLHTDDSLTPELRASYRRTLVAFLHFCQQRKSDPTVALARDYVELARLEHTPSPAQLQERNEEAGIGSEKSARLLNAECGVRSAECGVRSAEMGEFTVGSVEALRR
jgi:hypothetical protein